MDPLTFYGAMGMAWLVTFLVVYQLKGYRRTLQRMARRLGLRHEQDLLTGELHGVAVVGRVLGKTVEGDQVRMRAASHWPLALDLGLALRSRADPDPRRGFAACFDVDADEDNRALELLNGDLQRHLLAELGRGSALSLNDRGVVVERAVYSKDEAWLPVALDFCARTTRLVRGAASSVTPATPLSSVATRWQQLARRHGLFLFADSPLRVEGQLWGAHTTFYVVRTGPLAYAYELRVALREPLGLGLLVQPAALHDRHAEPLAADVRLGDRTFDDEFVVRADDGEALRTLFDDPLREHILGLQQRHGPLFLLDDAVGLRRSSLREDDLGLEQDVALLSELAERVQARLRGEERSLGPYR